MDGSPKVLVESNHYMKFEVADKCYWELVYYAQDSILFVQTVCSPICSSVAGIYTGDGRLIHTVPSPAEYVLPVAQIQNNQLVWADNVDEMLDDVEKHRKYTKH